MIVTKELLALARSKTMNARAEMPEPDFELIIGMLASPHMHGRSRFDEQGERLRAWLAAQPLAPEGGGGPAAGAVVVDDQMVKVAMEAYEAGDPWADIPTFCGMRAALTAAIGGG